MTEDATDVGRRGADVLRAGGVVAYPTDTFYGLAVDPRNGDAVAALFALKGRDAGKPSPLIVSSIEQARLAVQFNPVAETLAARFWPGPLSLVLPVTPALCRAAFGGGTTAAVRVPDHAVARAVAEAFGFCITATSANVSGRPPARTPAEIDPEVVARVDLVIDGVTPGGEPSTIVDVTGATPQLVRAGAIAWERVLESLQ
jgi:L-threonylcarbamoyladenylate synthase